ncbi:hypothetical protein [Micromonospora sp. NPDC005324]|uniref:hypothetical protein n=1 Tax=Micromonospora sp. NPDC005324 TaxID=3157033 RepID=UPI0033A1A8C1
MTTGGEGFDGELFRFEWRGSHYVGRPVEDLWTAIGRDADGEWWFDAYYVGRLSLHGGALQAAEFARWLLAVPPDDSYESGFLLIDDEPAAARGNWNDAHLSIEFLLGRDEPGGPEYLQIIPTGYSQALKVGLSICAELECQPVSRSTLEHAARRLLAIAVAQGPHTNAT